LLLARLLTKPSNVLVMDEPTNDLDIETLELLEELLIEYPGTLLLVSHDREFLNNVVTSTLVLEGEGRVKEYAGGYDDWIRQRSAEPASDKPDLAGLGSERSRPGKAKSEKLGKSEVADANTKPKESPQQRPSSKERPKRLTYAEQQELKSRPERIETLESALSELHQTMADPAFYRRNASEIVQTNARLQSLEKDRAQAYQRWEALEAIQSQGK
jgi:ABC transport system ATP-binding/permease protein